MTTMVTFDKAFTFDSDSMGLADAGLSAGISFAYEGGDGSPSAGCVKWSGSVAAGASDLEKAHRPTTGEKWSDWIPDLFDNGTVTQVELLSCDVKAVATPGVIAAAAQARRYRLIDAAGNNLLASDLGAATLVDATFFWTTGLFTTGAVAVLPGNQVGTTDVRLELEQSVTNSFAPVGWTKLLDNIILRFTYVPGSPPPPGGLPGGLVPDAGECTPSIDTNILGTLASDQVGAAAWWHDNCLYLSMGRRTYIYDSRTGGWSDSNYGNVRQGMVVNVPNHEELMWLLMPGIQGGNSGNSLAVTSKMFRPGVPQTLADWPRAGTPAALINEKRYVFVGPFDGVGPDRETHKHAIRLTVWGDYEVPNDFQTDTAQIGTVTMYSDNGYSETYPIIPYRRVGYTGSNPPRNVYPSMLVRQGFSKGMRGRVLWAKLVFSVPCVSIRDSMLEYVRVHGER